MSLIILCLHSVVYISVWRCKDTLFFRHGRKNISQVLWCATKILKNRTPLPHLTAFYQFLPHSIDCGGVCRPLDGKLTANWRISVGEVQEKSLDCRFPTGDSMGIRTPCRLSRGMIYTTLLHHTAAPPCVVIRARSVRCSHFEAVEKSVIYWIRAIIFILNLK